MFFLFSKEKYPISFHADMISIFYFTTASFEFVFCIPVYFVCVSRVIGVGQSDPIRIKNIRHEKQQSNQNHWPMDCDKDPVTRRVLKAFQRTARDLWNSNRCAIHSRYFFFPLSFHPLSSLSVFECTWLSNKQTKFVFLFSFFKWRPTCILFYFLKMCGSCSSAFSVPDPPPSSSDDGCLLYYCAYVRI